MVVGLMEPRAAPFRPDFLLLARRRLEEQQFVATAAWLLHVGAGVRLTFPGTVGAFRLDLASGLRDGDVVLSMGWQPGWPPWEGSG